MPGYHTQAYNAVQSFHSDSAVSFALFLNHLPNMCVQHQPHVLLTAMQVGTGVAWCGCGRQS